MIDLEPYVWMMKDTTKEMLKAGGYFSAVCALLAVLTKVYHL